MAYRNVGEGRDKGLEHLPFPIASLLSDYAREKNEEIKLHRLVDAAELVTRFCAILMLSDLAGAGMSQRLKDTLSRNLAFPSFGKWKVILHASLTDLRQAAERCFVQELPEFVERVLLRSLDASRDYIGIISMRNWLVHSAWASRSWIHGALADSDPVLSSIVDGLQFMSDYELVGCDSDGQIHSLKGLSSDGQPCQGLSTYVPRGTVAFTRMSSSVSRSWMAVLQATQS